MSGLTEYEKNTVKNRRKKKKQLMLERIKEIEAQDLLENLNLHENLRSEKKQTD